MDSIGRAVRRFERFLFLRPHEPLREGGHKVVASIVFRPDQESVEVIRTDEERDNYAV